MYINNNWIFSFSLLLSQDISVKILLLTAVVEKVTYWYYLLFVKHARRNGKSICVIQWHRTDGPLPFLKSIDLTTGRIATNYLRISLNFATKLLYSWNVVASLFITLPQPLYKKSFWFYEIHRLILYSS